ncbi:MAG TPA: MlaE family lipid ABC transporter permease subunit [Thermodesulfobacteriota bacterium]|nr:MlaE family lipid ABC transporter permease subunit [Thermodesulfobacteriota bacterium]
MNSQKTYSINVQGEKDGDVSLSLSGRIEVENLHLFASETDALMNQMTPRKLLVDLSKVGYLDSAGALGLLQLEDRAKARSIPFQFDKVTEEAKRIMGLIDRKALTMKPLVSEEKSNIIEQIGDGSLKIFNDAISIITFSGDLTTAVIYSFIHPRSIRWEDLLFYMKRAGMEGLPIVGLINFLLGLIIAFMSSLQLKQFGANIYVAQLVGVAMVTELGPIMTAIIVAGRSGSAFAAEIGTMKVNEEVDALVSMGFDPTRFLAIPKVLAAMLVVPVLTLYADFFGIAGGAVVGVLGLDLTLYTYVQETMKVISIADIVKSLIKSVVFAVLIAGIGCQRGFQVRGGAEAVGSATTSAVVAAIFLVIVTDSAFAILFTYI